MLLFRGLSIVLILSITVDEAVSSSRHRKPLNLELILGARERLKSECHGAYENKKAPGGCKIEFDGLWQCWPPTPINETVRIQCSSLIFKPGYITRKCLPNGKWDRLSKTIISTCKYLSFDEMRKRKSDLLYSTFDQSKHQFIEKELKRVDEQAKHVKTFTTIDVYMRYIDLGICFISLILIVCFVSSKDQRFILHKYLILAFFLMEPLYLFNELYLNDELHVQKTCTIVWLFKMYLIMVQISMMFSEGFYQFRQFYFVFITKSNVYKYIAFSYGFPVIIVFGIYFPIMHSTISFADPFRVCWSYYERQKYSYIMYTPMFLLLFLNLMITIYMMNLIITKLRGEKTTEFNKAKKGARGFMVLVVLLGFGYMITLMGPKYNYPYQYVKAVVQPLQGILVCLLQVIFSQQVFKGYRRWLKKCLRRHNEERHFSERRRQGSIASGTSASSAKDLY
uniref:Uncharacterized protein n=1 Tax=Clytia hemisphaerica TaxID=252671 RepID=A0A7M5XDQ7_9CNID